MSFYSVRKTSSPLNSYEQDRDLLLGDAEGPVNMGYTYDTIEIFSQNWRGDTDDADVAFFDGRGLAKYGTHVPGDEFFKRLQLLETLEEKVAFSKPAVPSLHSIDSADAHRANAELALFERNHQEINGGFGENGNMLHAEIAILREEADIVMHGLGRAVPAANARL